jgi:hypothetical protein
MDDHDEDEGAAFPLAVTIAGWVWILQGFVWVIATFWIWSVGRDVGACVGLFTFAAGVRMCFVGHEVIRGEAKELIYAAVVSVLIGVPLLACLLAAGRSIPLIVHVGLGVFSTSLVAAGLLAMFGRGAYLRWRREHARRDGDAGASDEPPS